MPNTAQLFWSQLRMAEDAFDRAKDGAEAEAWERGDLDYASNQLSKAMGYLERARILIAVQKGEKKFSCTLDWHPV